MAWKKGNNEWMKRITVGRKKVFASPESMLQAYVEYCKWVDANPLQTIVKGQGSEPRVPVNILAKKVVYKDNTLNIPARQPYTMKGFCTHWGVSENYLNSFVRDLRKEDPQRNDFLEIVAYIKDHTFNQQYTGAAVGHFKEALIVRSLGLADTVHNKNENVNINSEPLSKDEIKDIANELNDEL